MDKEKTLEITQILGDWNDGDKEAKDRLVPFVYDELKRQARILMSRERRNHTLQPTALVHEALMRITEQTGIEWQDRSHFYGIASYLMRQILVEYARKHSAGKRGNNIVHLSLEAVQIPIEERSNSIVALDEALERLSVVDERQAKVVEMRFFGGLNNLEIGEALDISDRTVLRLWKAARFWLYRELNQPIPNADN